MFSGYCSCYCRRHLNSPHSTPFSRYSMLLGSNGPFTTSTDCMIALSGRTLLDGSVAVIPLKLEEKPCASNRIKGRTKDPVCRPAPAPAGIAATVEMGAVDCTRTCTAVLLVLVTPLTLKTSTISTSSPTRAFTRSAWSRASSLYRSRLARSSLWPHSSSSSSSSYRTRRLTRKTLAKLAPVRHGCRRRGAAGCGSAPCRWRSGRHGSGGGRVVGVAQWSTMLGFSWIRRDLRPSL
jgi:hypothetical protein